MDLQLTVAHAVTPAGVVDNATIEVRDGRILSVAAGPPVPGPTLWAVPGFVDTHCHGAVGVSFGDPDPERNRRAVGFHRSQGTTTLFASTVTEPLDRLEAQLGVLSALVESGDLDGIHLEGPFLAPERKGAHDQTLLRDPDPDSVERLLRAGGPALKMITLAVELPHAEAATRRFTEAGVAVAFGHSDADDRGTAASIGWGARVATHLFSAMRPIHHRDPGPVPVLLTDERVMVELICDGVHHHPVVAEMAIAAATPARVALVTDAMSATGHGDGRYILGDLEVEVSAGTARLVTADGEPGAIAGSTLTMAGAFEFVVRQVGASIPDAALMAATTPAAWHGLDEVGQLVPGRFADICLVDDAGRLHGVLRRGQWVRRPALHS
ncbi:N-acetylglucosamine-6-phosphate deacetylase [Tessaracoccus lapidicaptus]|uniref:N-acetylglucosamine-6-phosphate deacetylase n=1 Tax=Tessaracoccus lapidicaptus TaxID=1427523 RepID=A0A1C0AM37_9ACTN|nr:MULTISPECIES: N-acetylglucosamine-6-phosphate deacetylase [Tessaracoccus]AQX15375.1 N-acetylglucosamine-6-phosphate deacetylase [Tessaracoccus sp. T2.5-30]OCL33746.1 N-acetylglucosamine-6-phosphate deacetylase [Tessaracoccus lapidicaptus]VEP39669.1 N-acetylglucosamine-6-phosphate deacetylase [Tessaracoccus lapidicaptus]